MHQGSADKADRAAEITPQIVSSSPWSVAWVKALAGFRLAVGFRDGTEGTVDMAALIDSPTAGVFACLRERKFFEQVFVEYGAVTWPGALDLAPDAMYDAIQAHGEYQPEPFKQG